MSRQMDRIRREAVEEYGPAPTTPVEALTHVVAVWADGSGDRMMVEATSNIYDRGVRTGLTLADLQALANRDAQLTDFARRIIALDDVDGPGAEERRTVTLNQIIGWARQALGEDA